MTIGAAKASAFRNADDSVTVHDPSITAPLAGGIRSPRECDTCGYSEAMHDPTTGECPIRYAVELTPHGHYVTDLHTNERIAGPLPLAAAEDRWRAIERGWTA